MSMRIGKLTARQACYLVLGNRTTATDIARACVRHTTAGRLRAAGFAVIHTPGRVQNGTHCTVTWLQRGEESLWVPTAMARFDSCFNEGEGRPGDES